MRLEPPISVEKVHGVMKMSGSKKKAADWGISFDASPPASEPLGRTRDGANSIEISARDVQPFSFSDVCHLISVSFLPF